MKKIFFLFFLLPLKLSAQEWLDNPTIPIDTTLKSIIYKEVVQVPGLTKKQIFNSAIGFFRTHFDIGHGVISSYDPEEGRIIVRATEFGKRFHGLIRTPFTFLFNIYIWVKDGKYKYQVSEFVMIAGVNSELIPQYDSADMYATDPKYKTHKGEFTMAAKEVLNVIDGNVHHIVLSIKSAIAEQNFSYPFDEDF